MIFISFFIEQILFQHRAGGGEKKIFDDKKYLRQSQADGPLSRFLFVILCYFFISWSSLEVVLIPIVHQKSFASEIFVNDEDDVDNHQHSHHHDQHHHEQVDLKQPGQLGDGIFLHSNLHSLSSQ